MFKPIIPLSKVTGWSAGGVTAAHTVTCDIQPGPRIHNVVMTGNAGAGKKMTDLIGDIRIIANDEVVRLHSATELNAKNVLYGPQYAAVNGNIAALLFHLSIHFAEPWRKDTYSGDILAWNTRNLRNLRIEVDIKADTYGAGIAPLTFQAEGDVAPLPTDAPGLMGLIVRTDRTNLNLAAGWNDVMSFPRSGAYQEMNFVTTSITDAEILIGTKRVVGPITLAQLRSRTIQRDMEPLYRAATSPDAATIGGTNHAAIRGMTDFVFDSDDKPNSALIPNPGEEFNIRLNTSGAITPVVLYNRLMPL